ncbi:electron transport complex subunit RsxC [Litorivicinus lipolyticus]|uniref:Ion-translocating oxidoreductase complex subunit C n=1 Tax=Litorivicinus lipolyticus TaxID=418701 RepID=A0A5Q2QCR9_9GAMM|nr:electron transport complex subunit RsxC [Litorivicinus lipolyticus]QGG79806.1 electron transport complex subunit RsxC [Litorivicinus lipolyticus]
MIHHATHSLTGGIHPDEHKDLSCQVPIRPTALSDTLVFSLQTGRHGLEPVVADGAQVLAGDCIARGTGTFAQAWHAPTSGTLDYIDDLPATDAYGQCGPGLRLTVDGLDRWCEPQPPLSREHDRSALIARIEWAGIAGMGGAGFPTHVKLAADKAVRTLIINMAECEPYISCDDALARACADDILAGASWVKHLIGASRVLIGIEDNKPEAIAALEVAIGDWPELAAELWVCPTVYPSGGEKQLIEILTGEQVPAGQLPQALGYHMHNPATLVAIRDAIEYGRPLTHRLVTLTGEGASDAGNRRVALGTPLIDLARLAGADEHANVIMGGPMMGFQVPRLDAGVIKTSNCLLIAPPAEVPAQQPCIRCGDCATVCPASLQPQTLFWQIQADDAPRAQAEGLMDCIECGACAYVCPSQIPLVSYYRHGKDQLRQRALDQVKSDRARDRFETRQARLDAEAAAKAAKRAARAQALEAAKAGGDDPRKAQVQAAVERARAKKKDAS